MPQFDSWSRLAEFLEQDLSYALKIIANDVKSIIKKYIYDKVYSAYTPKEYQRTGDLLNSLDVSSVTKTPEGYAITVFFNPDFIHSEETEGGKWNQHMSVDGSESWHGIPMGYLIPYIIEHGTSGSLWDRNGVESMKYVKDYLSKTNRHLKEIEKVLRSKGYEVRLR
jgi:hypothetical protein